MTEVTVGIVSWNTDDLLDQCLGALPAALGDLDAEVVVVDNGSTDRSVEIARRHPGVRVDEVGHNLGYASGMNRALGGSAAPVLIALNPDTEPPPGSLRRLVGHLNERPSVGLVAPRLIEEDGALQHSVHRFPSVRLAAALNLLPVRALRGRLGRRLWVEGTADHLFTGPVDWAIGAVHVMRAEAVGPRPYSERWFMYVEDVDLCWRLRQAGWDIELVGDVEVADVGNASGEQQWGADRTKRWLAATYDWYLTTHGNVATRAYAGMNLIGASTKGLAAAARGRLRRDAAAGQWGRELLDVIPLHARALVRPGSIHVDDAPSPQGRPL